jgi:hypothetical protein
MVKNRADVQKHRRELVDFSIHLRECGLLADICDVWKLLEDSEQPKAAEMLRKPAECGLLVSGEGRT